MAAGGFRCLHKVAYAIASKATRATVYAFTYKRRAQRPTKSHMSNFFSTYSSAMEIPSIIMRPLPNAVTYDLSSSNHVTITLPAGSTWSSGLHWHEQHVEYLRVVKGRVRVRLGNLVQIIAAGDEEIKTTTTPEVRVNKHVRHEWSRAEAEGEEVVVVERTEPQDGEKAIFFWNLNGVILDVQQKGSNDVQTRWLGRILTNVRVNLSLFVMFRALDNFPVFLDMSGSNGSLARMMEWLLTHVLLEAAAMLAWVWGVEPVQRRYTPGDVFGKWQLRWNRQQKTE